MGCLLVLRSTTHPRTTTRPAPVDPAEPELPPLPTQAWSLELLGRLLRLAEPAPPAAAAAAAATAEVRAAVVRSLRPRVPSLLQGLLSSVCLTGSSASIEPAAQLLHALAAGTPDEWRAATPDAVARLAADLAAAGRGGFGEGARELLVRACLVLPPPPRLVYVAMWTDMAQVARMGVNARVLEKYSRDKGAPEKGA